MKCMNCQAEIPPAWVAALAKNECPGCGGAIMDDFSRNLLNQIKEAMEKMPNDPQGLAGWLLSTFDLRPKGSVEPTNFHLPKPTTSNPAVGLTYANSPTSIFMKNAGVDKIMQNPKMAELAQAINNVVTEPLVSPDLPESEMTAEEEAVARQHDIQALAAKAAAAGRRLTAKELLANNVDFGGTGEGLNPEEVQAIQMALAGGPEPTLHPALEADRLKRLAAQRALQLGYTTNQGKFQSIRRVE